jgi:hypothetical protein
MNKSSQDVKVWWTSQLQKLTAVMEHSRAYSHEEIKAHRKRVVESHLATRRLIDTKPLCGCKKKVEPWGTFWKKCAEHSKPDAEDLTELSGSYRGRGRIYRK